MHPDVHDEGFMRCPVCGMRWQDLREFITDRQLAVVGYQACFVKPELGLVLLRHDTELCGTTVSIEALMLRDLYEGPEYEQRRTGQVACSEYCLTMNMVEECDVDCDMAWVRTVMQYLRRHELPAAVSEDRS